ncbi:MAG: hypothetical protein Q9213_005210 [Squamulea squamosa]
MTGSFRHTAFTWCITGILCLIATNAAVLNIPEDPMFQTSSHTSVTQVANGTSKHTVGKNPRFSAHIGFGDINLRPIAILMVGADALAQLALKDVTGRIPSTTFDMVAYPDVVIKMESMGPTSDISNEVALLCISQSIAYTAHVRRYRNSVADCLWDNELVARIHVEQQHPNQDTNRLSLTGGSSGAPLTLNASTAQLGALTPRFVFLQRSETFTVEDVFIVALAVLKEFAYKPNEDPVGTYTYVRANWSPASMLFEPISIRTRPPYFEYRWAIETIPKMLAFLVRARSFADLGIAIIVDDVHVGNAILDRRQKEKVLPEI